MTSEPMFYARRCDITGQVLNQGYVWRLGGIVTAVGEASERHALRMGFKSIKEAIQCNAAVFKAWTSIDDVNYKRTDSGELETLNGHGTTRKHCDEVEEFARHACMRLSREDLQALVQCISFGASVMRERIALATEDNVQEWTQQSDRAQRIAGQLSCLAVTAQDWIS